MVRFSSFVASSTVQHMNQQRTLNVAFPSFRAILHDDRLFSDPFTFKPERFIGSDVDPRVPAAVDYAFGFGRRVCPGRWMAHAFVWVVVASVLSSFRIEKVVRDGRVIEPTGAFSPGILACVLSPGCRCSLCPQRLLNHTGARKNSSAMLSRAQRMLRHSFGRPRLHNWFHMSTVRDAASSPRA